MNIPSKDLLEFETLGKGSFGEVRKGKYLGTPVAIKTLLREDDISRREFNKEVMILESLTHPNVVRIIAYDTTRIVMELYDSSLKKINTTEEMCLVARDCMRAIAFMHSHNSTCIKHRDIKKDNILVNFDKKGNIIKAALGDLGLAKECSSKTYAGTEGYMPVITNGSDRMHDIFALAVSILDAVFDQYVHGAKGIFENLEDYPQPGIESPNGNNTMYYAEKLLPRYYVVLSKMLTLVYMPGDSDEDKRTISRSILDEWENLIRDERMVNDYKVSPLKRLLNKFKR